MRSITAVLHNCANRLLGPGPGFVILYQWRKHKVTVERWSKVVYFVRASCLTRSRATIFFSAIISRFELGFPVRVFGGHVGRGWSSGVLSYPRV